MVRDKLHCGELIKRLNDILGTCANKELKSDDMTASQIKMLIIISETKNESITLKELEKHFGVACIRPLSAAIRAAFSGQTGPY